MSTTARTQGLYVDRVDMMEEDFQTYSPYFGGHLLALFKIRYNLPPEMSAFLEDRPLPTVYFHGTGHCGCAMNHIALGSSTHTRIPISDWCSSNAGELTNRCAAHGILTSGHLMTISRGGHFFSPNMNTAKGYARSKGNGSAVLTMFICKIQNDNAGHTEDIRSVHRDTDILPVYLAIVNSH